jgi:hypothetical protein
MAKLVLFIELVGKLGEVDHEDPLDVKGLDSLLCFKGCDDQPLGSEMLDDCLGCSNVGAFFVIFEFFDSCGIDGITYDFVNDVCFKGLLFLNLLEYEVVQASDRSSIRERVGVHETRGNYRRC